MTLEEQYKLLLEKKRRQEKLDPGLEQVGVMNAPDIIGEGLGEEAFLATEGMAPEKRALLATMARIAPDAASAVGGLAKGVYDAAKSGLYNGLDSIPRRFNQSGAIHGQNSNLFPASWRGKEGRLKQLQDEGYSKEQIWQMSKDETGFGIWDQPLYRDGQYVRSDAKMNVPDINLNEGPFNIDQVGKLDTRRNYPATYFRENSSMEAGYPDQYNAGTVSMADDANMLGEPMNYQVGKHSNKGKVGYGINREADYIPATEDSLLPRFAAADQGVIQDTERFASGGKQWDPATQSWAGNVEQRAVENEMRTIMDMRAEGMSNRDIIDALGNKPIYKTYDTPDIMQQTVRRSDIGVTPEPSGRVPNRYKQGPTEYIDVPGPTVYREPPEPDFELPPVKKGKKSGLGSKKELEDALNKISNFFN